MFLPVMYRHCRYSSRELPVQGQTGRQTEVRAEEKQEGFSAQVGDTLCSTRVIFSKRSTMWEVRAETGRVGRRGEQWQQTCLVWDMGAGSRRIPGCNAPSLHLQCNSTAPVPCPVPVQSALCPRTLQVQHPTESRGGRGMGWELEVCYLTGPRVRQMPAAALPGGLYPSYDLPEHRHVTGPCTLEKTMRSGEERLERGRAAQLERISKRGQIGKALKEGACVRVVAIAKGEVVG